MTTNKKTRVLRWLVPAAAAFALRGKTRELRAPDDAVVTCRYGSELIAWAVTVGSTGLTYYASDGGEPIELGWGYDGHPACVIGENRGRHLVSWGWADSYGGNPELRVAVLEHGRRIAFGEVARGGWEIHPVAIRPLRDGGWRIWYRDVEDGPVDSVRVDRNGR